MATPVRRRTRARELALQFLYACDMRGEEAMTELDAFIEHHTKTGEAATNDPPTKDRIEIAGYAHQLVRGVYDHLDEVNRWIEHIARNWRLDRMAYLDRNILRIALYELLHHPEVPFKVVINEAIDIAKQFSTAQSGSFVNGILDRARILIEKAREEGGDTVPRAPDAGMEGQGAAENSTNYPPEKLSDNSSVPLPAHSGSGSSENDAPHTTSTADAEESGDSSQTEEFPTSEDLAEPAALPRPRPRPRRHRRPSDSSDSERE
ncbi:MAG: transcription antitermination factor NusB [Planctomycetes bacterium]|nr:transcription antitermination factor NusB [Planctomycetota bacterium]